MAFMFFSVLFEKYIPHTTVPAIPAIPSPMIARTIMSSIMVAPFFVNEEEIKNISNYRDSPEIVEDDRVSFTIVNSCVDRSSSLAP